MDTNLIRGYTVERLYKVIFYGSKCNLCIVVVRPVVRLGAPPNPVKGRVSAGPNIPRDLAGVVPTINAHADSRLLQRFRDSPHSTISAMLEGHDVEVPTHNNDPVCLTWALKGRCSSSCKRKAQHVRYPRSVAQALHAMMDTCGVANSQP